MAPEVEAPAPAVVPTEALDQTTAVKLVLKKALAHDGLARGLREVTRYVLLQLKASRACKLCSVRLSLPVFFEGVWYHSSNTGHASCRQIVPCSSMVEASHMSTTALLVQCY